MTTWPDFQSAHTAQRAQQAYFASLDNTYAPALQPIGPVHAPLRAPTHRLPLENLQELTPLTLEFSRLLRECLQIKGVLPVEAPLNVTTPHCVPTTPQAPKSLPEVFETALFFDDPSVQKSCYAKFFGMAFMLAIDPLVPEQEFLELLHTLPKTVNAASVLDPVDLYPKSDHIYEKGLLKTLLFIAYPKTDETTRHQAYLQLTGLAPVRPGSTEETTEFAQPLVRECLSMAGRSNFYGLFKEALLNNYTMLFSDIISDELKAIRNNIIHCSGQQLMEFAIREAPTQALTAFIECANLHNAALGKKGHTLFGTNCYVIDNCFFLNPKLLNERLTVLLSHGIKLGQLGTIIPKTSGFSPYEYNQIALLSYAAYTGDVKTCATLIEQGACIYGKDFKQFKDHNHLTSYTDNEHYWNKTPLHWAIVAGQLKTVQFLLQHKADPNISLLTIARNSPLMMAIEEQHSDIARLLIKSGANINFNCAGFTPLLVAMLTHDEPIIDLLLDKGANIYSARRASHARGTVPTLDKLALATNNEALMRRLYISEKTTLKWNGSDKSVDTVGNIIAAGFLRLAKDILETAVEQHGANILEKDSGLLTKAITSNKRAATSQEQFKTDKEALIKTLVQTLNQVTSIRVKIGGHKRKRSLTRLAMEREDMSQQARAYLRPKSWLHRVASNLRPEL